MKLAEYIEREALIQNLCHSCDGWCDKVDCDCVNCICEHRCEPVVEIANAPAADVVEVRHGEWIMGVDIADYEYGTCSVCGYVEWDAFPAGRTPNYCPDCGAKMDGKGEQ